MVDISLFSIRFFKFYMDASFLDLLFCCRGRMTVFQPRKRERGSPSTARTTVVRNFGGISAPLTGIKTTIFRREIIWLFLE